MEPGRPRLSSEGVKTPALSAFPETEAPAFRPGARLSGIFTI
jgi:hypothetical protein